MRVKRKKSASGVAHAPLERPPEEKVLPAFLSRAALSVEELAESLKKAVAIFCEPKSKSEISLIRLNDSLYDMYTRMILHSRHFISYYEFIVDNDPGKFSYQAIGKICNVFSLLIYSCLALNKLVSRLVWDPRFVGKKPTDIASDILTRLVDFTFYRFELRYLFVRGPADKSRIAQYLQIGELGKDVEALLIKNLTYVADSIAPLLDGKVTDYSQSDINALTLYLRRLLSSFRLNDILIKITLKYAQCAEPPLVEIDLARLSELLDAQLENLLKIRKLSTIHFQERPLVPRQQLDSIETCYQQSCDYDTEIRRLHSAAIAQSQERAAIKRGSSTCQFFSDSSSGEGDGSPREKSLKKVKRAASLLSTTSALPKTI